MSYITTEIKRNKTNIKDLFKMYIKNQGFICGGYARWACSKKRNPEKASDVDIYCLNEQAYDEIKSRFLNSHYKVIKETPVSCSLGDFGVPLFQLIKPIKKGHLNTASEDIKIILDNFDFTIARIGIYYSVDEKIKAICDSDFHEHDKKKTLVIKNIHCPIAQIYRVSKYMKKGYWLKALEAVKILEDWETRDDDYRKKVLQKLRAENLSKTEIEELEALLHID